MQGPHTGPQLGLGLRDKGERARRKQGPLDIPFGEIARVPARRPEQDLFDPRLERVFFGLVGHEAPCRWAD